MQEEIEQKSFNIMISTTKLSARTVLRAVKAAFRLYQSKASQGKQSVRTLLRQNRGVSSVEISKTGIRGLERYAKKYGIDYAIRKDISEVPPRYLVFFKAPDAEAFNLAFKEYSASLLNKDNRLPVVPEHQYRAELTWRHASGVFVTPSIEWRISRPYVDYANTMKAPDYALLGLSAGFDMRDGLSVFIDARNLTDERYVGEFSAVTDARTASTSVFFPGEGRSVFVGLRLAY